LLAVTFTNKAAEEMKIRILSTLNELVDKDLQLNFTIYLPKIFQI